MGNALCDTPGLHLVFWITSAILFALMVASRYGMRIVDHKGSSFTVGDLPVHLADTFTRNEVMCRKAWRIIEKSVERGECSSHDGDLAKQAFVDWLWVLEVKALENSVSLNVEEADLWNIYPDDSSDASDGRPQPKRPYCQDLFTEPFERSRGNGIAAVEKAFTRWMKVTRVSREKAKEYSFKIVKRFEPREESLGVLQFHIYKL